ncbi:hypothetical protein GE09DRAFT_168424 [Coniochaeta sp. 2T2.1]|nr:hypothetical protein GE09DRAFT_168424 [Coniochaeta sp. 2T2.1]
MSRRYGDTPDRTWSSDSHLLPAGIRHVPRSDNTPHGRSEPPPVRPWQQGEPAPRERPPHRVRFQDSYDDYRPAPPPPPPFTRRARDTEGLVEYGFVDDFPSRPGPRQRRSTDDYDREDKLERARRALELQRIHQELELTRERRRQEERLRYEKEQESKRREEEFRLEWELERRRLKEEDMARADRQERRRARSASPPASASLDRRRSRSTSPPERVVKTERYFEREDKLGKAEIYADPESYDAGPARDPSSTYDPPPPPPSWYYEHSVPPPPAAETGADDDDSDTTWDSSSDVSYESYVPDYERKIYEFNPSHLSRKPSQDASTTLSGSIGDISTAVGSNNGERGPRGSSPDAASGAKVVRPLRIYQSEYTGDGFPEGSHSVKLTAVLDSKRQRQPLFRWRHISQTTMNFDELSKEVGRIGGLSDADNHGLNRLLSDVKKYSIKSIPTSKGSNVKHMEPGMLQVKLDAGNSAKTKNMPARTVTWLCIPYFSLQKYTGPLSSATSGSFPTRTLLQEQYSGVSAERDMQQAVCQTGHVPPGTCFHVAQLWCIVLDDSLLITCGTMSDPTKKGDFDDMIDLVTKPSQDPSSSVSTFIYVYYTEAVMYALPIDQCRSWFAFCSHFHDFWPNTLKFTHRDRLVTAAEWPTIFNIARLSSGRTLLVLSLGTPPQPPARGVLKSLVKDDDEDNDKTKGTAEEERKPKSSLKPPNKGKEPAKPKSPPVPEPEEDRFHIFSWLESFTPTGEAASQEQAESLRQQLQEMEDFLNKDTSRPDRQVYQSCFESTREACLKYLEQQAAMAKKNSSQKRYFENRVDVLNAAEIVFRFFLPLQSDGPTVTKFWGAIYRLVQMPKSESLDYGYSRRPDNRDSQILELNVGDARSALRELTQHIQSFANIISHAQPLERASLTVPIQLIRAWIYLLLALAKATKKATSNNHFDNARELLKEGMAEVMQNLPSEDLLAREVVLPMELVSLLSLKLLQDTTGTYPNLDTIYSEYLNALDNEVATKPSERSFEHRINLLKQEATVINRIVGKQRRIFAALTPTNCDPVQNFNLIASSAPAPSKKRALEETDYYQSYQAQAPTVTYRERHSEMERVKSADHVRSYSRAPTIHEDYTPHHISRESRRHWGGDREVAYDNDDVTPAAKEYYRLSPTRPGGFRDLLTTDCLALIDRRYAAFAELFPYANYLQEYNKNKWEDTKDRQEQAIYAFTIVTVIFLPLSAVAGIFGMNTADVRDMNFDQWLYWVIAVPVTISVILIGLWWMGELRNAFSWLPWMARRDGYAAVIGAGGGGYRGKKMVRVVRDEGEMLVPAVMVQRPSVDVGLEEDDDDRPVMVASRPMVVRHRSSGPGYGDEYTGLEAGGQRRYSRPWAD